MIEVLRKNRRETGSLDNRIRISTNLIILRFLLYKSSNFRIRMVASKIGRLIVFGCLVFILKY